MGCNLPNECDCSDCQWWGDNGWDMSRTPDWQRRQEDEDDYYS